MVDGSPRILIVRLSAIGDVVRVLPALHILRQAHPAARIDWAVERKSAGILEGHPALDELLVYERPKGALRAAGDFVAFCNRIRGRHYDIVVDFHGIFKSGLISAASLARLRYGFSRPRSQELSWLFYNRRVRLASAQLNRSEENLALCDNVVARRKWPTVTIYVPLEVQEEVDAYFESFEGGKRVIAMHVPVDRPEKQWPARCFAELADMLLADGRFEVVLTYGPGQRRLLDEVLALSRRKAAIAPETPDLKHYAWFAHRADLYVGGDTGPMHIAAAMGTPVVAIFGGTDPRKHATYLAPHIALYHGESIPGQRLTARDRLEAITPEAVYDACVRMVLEGK